MTAAGRGGNSTCVVVDSGLGNIQSVANMLRRVGAPVVVASTADDCRTAQKLILPGVGAFDGGMAALRRSGLDEAVLEAAGRGAHVLGICLGMHLLFEGSEEGRVLGLGLIPGRVGRFRLDGMSLKIPHMGWNVVRPTRESALFSLEDAEQRYYHVHSYHVLCEAADDVTAVTRYGYDFPCAVQRGTVMGVQFHPEKSHRFGMALMQRFAALPC